MGPWFSIFSKRNICQSNVIGWESTVFRLFAWVIANRSVVVFNSLPIFTKLLHTGPEFGQFYACCMWVKPEVEIRFSWGANFSFSIDYISFWTTTSAILYWGTSSFACGSELIFPCPVFLRETGSWYRILEVYTLWILAAFKL